MANLRDSEGRIVINSAEAQADINQLTRAKGALESYKSVIRTAETRLRMVWEGTSYNSYSTKTRELVRDIDRAIEQIDVSIRSIRDAVRNYQETDRRLADIIRNAIPGR